MSSSLLPLIAVTLALSSFGCAGSADPTEPDNASEDDVTAALIRDVAAVDFEVRIRGMVTAGDTVAAPAKVARVLKSASFAGAARRRPRPVASFRTARARRR
jgi:hypothetical protein